MYVKLENNIPVQWPINESDIRSTFPNTSLPEYISKDIALELGYHIFITNAYPSEYDAQWQNIEEVTPVLKDGEYHQTYKITDKFSPEEKNSIQEQQSRGQNKTRAEQLLKETDWAENPSVSDVTKAVYLSNFDEIMEYRMALRLIAIDPQVVVEFPKKPENVWVTN